LTKKKPTKKELETVISNMINHIRFIEEKLNALDSLFGLYLQWKKEKDKFNKFVSKKLEKHQTKISENKPGETK
jgi:hypothetical protein